MSIRRAKVKVYKRGARWPDGQPRMCTRCGADKTRQRRRQATMTAELVDGPYRIPVGYCDQHHPEETQ